MLREEPQGPLHADEVSGTNERDTEGAGDAGESGFRPLPLRKSESEGLAPVKEGRYIGRSRRKLEFGR